MKPGAIFWRRDADGYVIVGVANKVDSNYTEGIGSHYSPEGRWLSTSSFTLETKSLAWEPSELFVQPACRNCGLSEVKHAHEGDWCPSETSGRIWSHQFRFEAAEAVHV